MKLVYPDYTYQVVFQEEIINTVVIENQAEFTHLVGELTHQCNGGDGRFVLSEEDKILKIGSSVQCIINPMTLTLNTKRILDKIYEQLDGEIQSTELYLDEKDLHSIMYGFVQKVIDRQGYPLIYDEQMESKSVFKMMNLRWPEEDETLLSKIVDYMKLNQELLKCRVFVFVNLKSFLTEEELHLLYKTCLYEKYNLLLIESMDREEKFDSEKVLIIDKDCCEIY